MAEMIKFLRGNVASLPQTATAGAVYFTKDEGLYLGLEDGSYHRYGDFITVANVAALPEAGAHETCMYYCTEENILAKWDGSTWVQINKQKTLAELGGVAKSVYDAKMALLEKADTDNATAISNLKTYVGTIPADAGVASVVAYVDKKTSGIATDTALSELQTKVNTAESEIDALQAAIAEGGSVATDIANAQAAADKAQGEVDALETAVDEYKTSNDAAVAAAKKAGDDAQADVDALAEKVGTVPADKTVVEMIADAQTAATYDDTQVKADIAANAKSISDLDAAYKAADVTLQGNIDAKVDQTAYDQKVAALEAADTALANEDARLAGLIGDNADAIADNAEAIAAVKEDVDAFLSAAEVGDAAVDTLKEIQAYITTDGAAAAQMASDIADNAAAIAALDTEVGAAASEGVEATGLYKVIADGDAALQAEIDKLATADETNLQAAKDYADAAVTALGIADYVKKADADATYAVIGHNHDDKYDAIGAAAQALTDAKAYADQAEADAVATAAADATAKADAAQAAAIAAAATDATNKADAAKAYADTQDASLKTELQGYADQAEADAKAYADGLSVNYDAAGAAADALAEAKTYADTAETDAVTAANAYTDSALTWGSF